MCFRGGPLIIQGGSENEKKIGPDIGSEKKNRAKIFEKNKKSNHWFSPIGHNDKKWEKKSGQASVQKLSFLEKISAKKNRAIAPRTTFPLDD